jgi:hypothetical protein
MARTLLLTYPLVAVVYSTLVTSLTGEFIGPEWLSSVYDSLGTHLIRLNAEVDPDAIQFEGLRVQNRVYAYFGPFPALLRIMLNAVWPEFYGQWSRLSCFTAAFLSVVAFGTMVSLVSAQNIRLSEGTRQFLCAVLVLGFAFGTPMTDLVSCAVFVTLLSRVTFGVAVIVASPLVLLLGGAGGFIHPLKAPGEFLRRALAFVPGTPSKSCKSST